MIETTLVLTLAKSATLVFGVILTSLSWRAYRRTSDPALRALAAGIGLVTAGAIAGGLLHQVGGISLAVAVSVQSVFTATGFAFLTYSLYAGDSDSEMPEAREAISRGS